MSLSPEAPSFVSSIPSNAHHVDRVPVQCRLMCICKTRTMPGYPQSNGMVERFNRTLLNSLAMYNSNHQRDWEEYLPYVLFAYRLAVHESTGVSPSKMMLARDVRVPVDSVIQQPRDEIPHDILLLESLHYSHPMQGIGSSSGA